MQEEFDKYNNTINRLFILDNNDVMTVGLAQQREPLIGSDLSFRDWVRQTREGNSTDFSDGFERQGLADPFFSHYKNIENFEEGFLVSYNKDGDLLYNGLNKSLVGLNFFGPEVSTIMRS
jgi:hypothetical protein